MARYFQRGLACDKGLAAVVCLLLLAVCVDSAWAQRGRGFRRMFGISKAQIASLPEVQTELKMTDEQKSRVDEINGQLGEDRRELFGTGFDRWNEIRGRVEQLNRDASKQVDDLLDEPQRKRLLEISIQQNGPRALNDPDVIAELKLSDEQKAKLAAADDDNNKAFEKAVEDSGRDNWRQRVGELGEEADKRLLGVLNEDQQKQFEKLGGEPFNVDLSQLFRGRRGGR
jgi:hypothetical protein